MICCEATASWVSFLIWSFGLWWSNHMPIKQLAITECDQMRARQIERSWRLFFLSRSVALTLRSSGGQLRRASRRVANKVWR